MNRSTLLPAALLGAGVVVLTASPAAAHVELTAPGAEPGTAAVLHFTAAAEDPESGITELATRLPEGVPAAGVTLAEGPEGWTLQRTEDGFVVGGPPLPAGTGVAYSVAVPTLPEGETELAFPTLRRYADGREDAWIEPSTPEAPDPAMPAPGGDG